MGEAPPSVTQIAAQRRRSPGGGWPRGRHRTPLEAWPPESAGPESSNENANVGNAPANNQSTQESSNAPSESGRERHEALFAWPLPEMAVREAAAAEVAAAEVAAQRERRQRSAERRRAGRSAVMQSRIDELLRGIRDSQRSTSPLTWAVPTGDPFEAGRVEMRQQRALDRHILHQQPQGTEAAPRVPGRSIMDLVAGSGVEGRMPQPMAPASIEVLMRQLPTETLSADMSDACAIV